MVERNRLLTYVLPVGFATAVSVYLLFDTWQKNLRDDTLQTTADICDILKQNNDAVTYKGQNGYTITMHTLTKDGIEYRCINYSNSPKEVSLTIQDPTSKEEPCVMISNSQVVLENSNSQSLRQKVVSIWQSY
jgi:hypothetical protein|tara:strand:- start:283 stop:681 length:399 start_codon:yes stop_codon:yes gene_type:complete